MSRKKQQPSLEEEYADLALVAELAQANALAAKFEAEAEHAKWQAKRTQLRYEREEANRAWQYDGVYTFSSRVSRKAADDLLHTLSVWDKNDPEQPWTIVLNSLGGSIFAGNAIIDELITYSTRGGGTHDITIKARGVAASMGACFLQAGDHRLVGPNSWTMIHKGVTALFGSADEICDMGDFLRRDTDMMIDYFLQRTDRITRPEFLAKIDHRDWWLRPEEMVELGFADGIG